MARPIPAFFADAILINPEPCSGVLVAVAAVEVVLLAMVAEIVPVRFSVEASR